MLLLLASCTASPGAIAVSVVDAKGATPLPGVKVIARNGVRSLVVETDSSGRAILVVPSGSWDVHAELPGTFSPPARQVKLRRGGSAGLIIPIRMFPDGTITITTTCPAVFVKTPDGHFQLTRTADVPASH
jgi:hypothetical protein